MAKEARFRPAWDGSGNAVFRPAYQELGGTGRRTKGGAARQPTRRRVLWNGRIYFYSTPEEYARLVQQWIKELEDEKPNAEALAPIERKISALEKRADLAGLAPVEQVDDEDDDLMLLLAA